MKALVLVLTLVVAPSAAAQESEKIPEAARLYFKNGIELLQASPPSYQDAYHQFREAYRLSKSWKVLGNLGLCALKLERDGEALAHYRAYFEQGGSSIDPEERAAIERELLLLDGNMAQVVLEVDRPVILTDTRQGSSVPPQAYELSAGEHVLGLRSGSHELVATSGEVSRSWRVTLTPRKSFAHTFDFAAPARAVGPKPAPVVASRSGSRSAVRTAGWVAVGVGAAALAGGVVTGVLEGRSEDAARDRLRADADRCLGNVCSSDARSEYDEARSLATLTNVLLVAGGVVAAGGVGLVIWGSSEPAGDRQSARTLSLLPLAFEHGGAVTARGSF